MFFEIISWAAMIAISVAAIPQIILFFRKKTTKGVSWLTYGLLFFGTGILFIRSLFVTDDLVIQLNYGFTTLIILVVNLQFIHYRLLKSNQ